MQLSIDAPAVMCYDGKFYRNTGLIPSIEPGTYVIDWVLLTNITKDGIEYRPTGEYRPLLSCEFGLRNTVLFECRPGDMEPAYVYTTCKAWTIPTDEDALKRPQVMCRQGDTGPWYSGFTLVAVIDSYFAFITVDKKGDPEHWRHCRLNE